MVCLFFAECVPATYQPNPSHPSLGAVAVTAERVEEQLGVDRAALVAPEDPGTLTPKEREHWL